MWHSTIRHVTIRYDTIRYDTLRYDTIRYKLSSILLFIDCVAHLCAGKGRYNETVPTHNLHPRNNTSLVSCCLQKNNIKVERCVCCMLLFMWVYVSVAWLHVSRVYTRARADVRERERERENEWEITAGKGRGGGETDFVTKIWRKKEGFLEDKIDWTTNETIIITAVSFWLKQFFQSYRLLFMEARFTDFHVMKNLHARICMYNNARIITRV